jgi:hypothetical protein
MHVCAEEKIIPRETVIRSKLEDTVVWDTEKGRVGNNGEPESDLIRHSF